MRRRICAPTVSVWLGDGRDGGAIASPRIESEGSFGKPAGEFLPVRSNGRWLVDDELTEMVVE